MPDIDTRRIRPASPKQVAYIKSLLKERDLTAEARPKWRARLEFLRDHDSKWTEMDNIGAASKCIAVLQGLPKLPIVAKESVPNGRYALPDSVGSISFYHVNTPTEGKWAGLTFVDRQLGPNKRAIRNVGARNTILEAIRRDPKAASLLYGKELGHCGVCGLPLTNDESRAAGIGPICRGKMGW